MGPTSRPCTTDLAAVANSVRVRVVALTNDDAVPQPAASVTEASMPYLGVSPCDLPRDEG